MYFSLLVATYGRYDTLARLLQSLCGQICRDFEVVLVDQNDPGFLGPLLQQFRDTLPLRVITVVPSGVSDARNAVFSHIRGDIIAFPDDDCWYAPHTLDRVRALFAGQSGLDGLVVGWGDAPRSVPDSPPPVPIGKLGVFRDAGTLVQFYRSAAVRNIRFDPELGPGTGLPYGCGEDTDFLLQVLNSGARVGKTAEVLVYHAKPDLHAAALLPKTRAYARGRMHLLRKHRFPLWFKVVTIFYPLLRVAVEGPKAWPYRKAMFLGRLSAFFSAKPVVNRKSK